MKTNLFLTACALLFATAACNPKPKTAIQCTLKGEVIDRPHSNFLLLMNYFDGQNYYRSMEELEAAGVIIIPITDGKFEYVLNCDYEEKYYLVFLDEYEDGSWKTFVFFSENGTVTFTLYPEDEGDRSLVEGGPLTTEYYALAKKTDEILKPILDAREQLQNEGKYFSQRVMELFEKRETATDNEWSKIDKELEKLEKAEKYFTPEAQALEKEAERWWKTRGEMRWQHAKEHPTIVGYSVLMEVANMAAKPIPEFRETPDIAPVEELFNTIYAPKYPNHPYTEKLKALIEYAKIVATIKVGGRYIDFELPDLDGKMFRLSEQIQGKMAIVQLWGSWCSPCRRKGKELIPVYEAYKDKGFTVVSVAYEKKIEDLKIALEKDKYPWLNLILEWDSPIWKKYGDRFREFLIDENGVILAINPTAAEVENILKERFK